MSMIDWAKQEIEIAKEKVKSNGSTNDYMTTCYDSAYKAYKSLCSDGHSGWSIKITRIILNRLIDGKPLVPIEDTDDIWNLRNYGENHVYTRYQCKRMSSLFKKVYPDGSVTYTDVDRCHGKDIITGSTYHSNYIDNIVDELFGPITMPYNASNTFEVSTEDFLYDKNNDDFDTIGVYYAQIVGTGVHININKFFAEDKNEWVEITKKDYDYRKNHRKEVNHD